MKTSVKMITCVLAIGLALSSLTACGKKEKIEEERDLVATRKVTEGDFTFQLQSDGESYFLKKAEVKGESSVVIPDSCQGKPVTAIHKNAFSDGEDLTDIEIPSSVLLIEKGAFSKTEYYMDESNWEDGVLYIGNHLIEAESDVDSSYTIKEGTICVADGAFAERVLLENINFPDTLKSIGSSAFERCYRLSSVELPEGLLYIGESAFCRCEGLTDLIIPDSVKEIGECAFLACRGLESVYIGIGVEKIGRYAFGDGEELVYFDIHCAVDSQPKGWNQRWNSEWDGEIYWGSRYPGTEKSKS